MSKKDAKDTRWKSEIAREERKARLESLKSGDGGKKPIKTRSIKGRVIGVILVLVVVVGLVGWYLVGSGILHRRVTAMTINGEKITPVELNYYMSTLASNYMQLDLFSDKGQVWLAEASPLPEYATNREYLMGLAADQLATDVVFASEARKENFTVSADDQQVVDGFFEQVNNMAAENKVDPNLILVQRFGSGANEASLRPLLERIVLVSSFQKAKLESYDYTPDELAAFYEADKDAIDRVTYRTYTFRADSAEDATEDEKQADVDKAIADAYEALAAINDEDSFQTVLLDLVPAEERPGLEVDPDATLVEDGQQMSILPDVGAWLFDETRKAGDKTVIETASGGQLLYFIERARPRKTYTTFDTS